MDGSDYILHSEESPFGTAYSCVPKEANPFAGPAQPMLTRISDDRKQAGVPVELGLEINEFSNCPEQLAAKEDNSVHYHDVDDPTNTTFVMASMWNSGIRVFDVRHPDEPKEVAYFNPADIGGTLDHTWGHLHWDPVTHDIWFASAAGGFWVVHMEDQVYGDLGLEHGANGLAVAAAHRGPGFPGTAGVHVPKPAGGWVDITAAYCTLAQARRLYAPA
jgi:hypothetical protein